MSCWALIALKTAASAKGRLSETLPAEQRIRLVHLMFEQVLDALRAARHIDGIAVVTTDPMNASDILCISDPGGGLNAALTQGAATLAERGVDEILLLHADLPLATPEEIDTLIQAGRTHGLALATDKLGQGTNALYAPLPLTLPLRFGIGSCQQHQNEATRQHRTIEKLTLPGLAFDIDEPQDLQRLSVISPQRYADIRTKS